MDKPIVLILCTGNSCRSQMAEAFLRHFHGDAYDVHSAGTEPAARVHPLAVRVMAEAGLDISGRVPKHSREFLGRLPVRHVVIVCSGADATCPRIWPGAFSRTFMPFDDPAAFVGDDRATLAEFRRVRDQIREAMRTFAPAPALWVETLASHEPNSERGPT